MLISQFDFEGDTCRLCWVQAAHNVKGTLPQGMSRRACVSRETIENKLKFHDYIFSSMLVVDNYRFVRES
jgi:hypothetical protein